MTMITVPVTFGFGDREIVGHMTVDEDLLPKTPNFCFSIGFMACDMTASAGEVPNEPPYGSYKLIQVAVVQDEAYSAYLQQTKVTPK